jgi:hypothetical protein
MPSDFGQAEYLIRRLPLPLAKLYQAPDPCADGQFDDGAAGIKLILKRRERGGRKGVLIPEIPSQRSPRQRVGVS